MFRMDIHALDNGRYARYSYGFNSQQERLRYWIIQSLAKTSKWALKCILPLQGCKENNMVKTQDEILVDGRKVTWWYTTEPVKDGDLEVKVWPQGAPVRIETDNDLCITRYIGGEWYWEANSTNAIQFYYDEGCFLVQPLFGFGTIKDLGKFHYYYNDGKPVVLKSNRKGEFHVYDEEGNEIMPQISIR